MAISNSSIQGWDQVIPGQVNDGYLDQVASPDSNGVYVRPANEAGMGGGPLILGLKNGNAGGIVNGQVVDSGKKWNDPSVGGGDMIGNLVMAAAFAAGGGLA